MSQGNLMFFNVPVVRAYLLEHGFVYTVRDHIIEGHKKAVYGSYYKQTPIGAVDVKLVKEFGHTILLYSLPSFVKHSGFRTINEWIKEIKLAPLLYLHEVRLIEPVKGEQAGMLGVPSKVHVQKRPWSPGQVDIESYQKYREAMKTPAGITTAVDYDRQYSLNELAKMCKDKGLSTSGDKKTLARRLIEWEKQSIH